MIADCGNIYTDNHLDKLEARGNRDERRVPKPPHRTPRGTGTMAAQLPEDLRDQDDQ